MRSVYVNCKLPLLNMHVRKRSHTHVQVRYFNTVQRNDFQGVLAEDSAQFIHFDLCDAHTSYCARLVDESNRRLDLVHTVPAYLDPTTFQNIARK